MRLTRYEKFLCKAVDALYITGALLLFFVSLVYALRYL